VIYILVRFPLGLCFLELLGYGVVIIIIIIIIIITSSSF